MYSLLLHGKRLVELHKWRHLRFVVQNATPFSNSFSSASSAAAVSVRDGRKGKNFTVSYLIDSLGLSTKVAESISRKISFQEKGNPDSVLNLLRSYCFTESQISSIVTIYPRLLILDAEKSLSPKLKFMQSRGASSSELTEIVSTVPKILGIKGEKTLSLYYDLVKEVLEVDKKSSKFKKFHSFPEGSKQGNKIRNVLVLRELGVPQKMLFSLLISDGGGPFNGKEKFEESLKKVVEMGFDPTTSKFLDALRIMQGFSDNTIDEKVSVFKRYGFAVEDVWAMFNKFPMFLGLSEKKIADSIETFLGLGVTRDEVLVMVKSFPSCLNLSTETVKKKTEFLVKEMNWSVEALVLTPQVLGYNLEKRTIPRCNVIKVLMSKGLLGDRGSKLPSMPSVLKSTDHDFLNRYVRKHDDKELVAELMAIFTGDHAS